MKQSILFVGNSYTYYNDMPEKLFPEKAAEHGLLFSVTAVTHGGYSLSRFADPSDEEGKRLHNVTANQYFDYVVLQEQSCNPIVDEADFLKSVEKIKTILAERGQHFVLYATWGRKSGSEKLKELGITSEEMTEKLAAAYERAGALCGMRVAQVGKAFAAYKMMHPNVELYDPDCSHPSRKGSEIAAQEILKTILELQS